MPLKRSLPKGSVKKKNNTHLSDNRRLKELEKLVEIISRGKYQWEATFDAITSPVAILSKDYRIERANLALAALCCKDIRKVIGRCCYEVFAERSEPCDGCPIAEAKKRNLPSSSMLGNRIRKREFEANAYSYAPNKKMADTTVVYYRDVTEEKRLRREAVQQEKMVAIGMLAGGIAHEINNPLGGILAMAQLLIRETGENKTLSADLREIEDAAIRCKKIVRDLLDFSRISNEEEKRLLNLNSLVEKVIPFVSSNIKSSNIKLELDLSADLPGIMGIPDRVQQIFLNLLTNACHAMPNGGTLKVKTSSDRRETVHILISDSGVGISEENLKNIFEPFFTTKGPSKGTGLGLSIVYRIVKEHGGAIDVDSKLGKGTTFTVSFPAAK